MNNSDVRQEYANLFPGTALKSYQDKQNCLLLYRFTTKNSDETIALLQKAKKHTETYPADIGFIQVFGIDGFDNSGAIIHIGTHYVPNASILFLESLTFSAI